MIEYIETATHVFRCEVIPDDPGFLPRTFRVTIERGPFLTPEQAKAVISDIVSSLVASGVDVKSWGAGE